MNGTETRFSQLYAIAKQAGQTVASDFGGYVTAEDMTQQGVAWLLEPARDKLLQRSVDPEGNLYHSSLVREVRRHLNAAARLERVITDGGRPSDVARYSSGTVTSVLSAAWTDERPDAGVDDSGIKHRADPATGGDYQATVLDVRRGVRDAVGKRDQAFLFARYVTGLSWDAVGELFDTTPDAARMRAARSVEAVVDYLNGLEPSPRTDDGPGTRTARSNAYMRHVAANHYEGNE